MDARAVRKYPPLFLHLLGWGFLAPFLMWQPLSWQIVFPASFWTKQAVMFTMLIGVFYLNYYIWFPRYLARNRYIKFIALNVISVLFLAYAMEQVKIYLHHGEQMDRAFRTAREMNGEKRRKDTFDNFALLTALMIIGLGTSVASVRNAQLDKQYRQNLEKEKINSELSFLKAQINPHFF